jgi:hypothetical protein
MRHALCYIVTGAVQAWSANLGRNNANRCATELYRRGRRTWGATMRTVARRSCTGVVGELGAQQCEPLRDGAVQAWSANLGRNNANRCETEL